ncbi:MAG: zinc-ribbon domain-containing protein [Chloroflexi bacterium]|nr:MAG: zinc-ribbon domain-containing protein [Chloroflexota bacterium]MBL1194185.1 zinc-ribbon domain-containing protein [Chloroflexota bacterium]NOH11477.1 zinc-ribbon domain-containing protein [Chloroflexota bacterium]
MDIGSILLILAVFVITAVFVVRPLIDGQSYMVSEEEQNLSSLLAERERILDALAELDFDHEMGKVPEDTYKAQRADLAKIGVGILRKIDASQPNGSRESSGDAVEAVIAERKQVVSAGSGGDDPLEDMIASRRSQQSAPATGKFCPQCGQGIHAGDKFCSHCGTVIDWPYI